MNGFFITISNGLLDGNHSEKMGTAVWEFMWLLDKVTSVDEKGIGKVLGGRPIKLDEITSTSKSRDTKSRNLQKLEKEGYINIVHAPYGIIITINKTKKIFNQQKEMSKNREPQKQRFDKNAKPHRKNVEPNINDKTNDKTTSPIGDEKTRQKIVLYGNYEINEGISLLTELTGGFSKQQLNRFALKRLYDKRGKNRVLKAIKFAFSVNDMPYAPTISNYMDLEEKWIKLETFARKEINKSQTKGGGVADGRGIV